MDNKKKEKHDMDKNRRRLVWYRRVRNICVVSILLFVSCFLITPVYAVSEGNDTTGYSRADSLNVTVGYYGMTMYPKGRYSLDEMAALGGYGREIYTFIDKSYSPDTGEGEGIWLGPFLDAIGVDRAAVSRYHFDASDNWGGEAGTEFTEGSLFGTTRYSFSDTILKNISDETSGIGTFDYNTGSWNDSVWTEARVVEPMLAVKSDFNRWNDKFGYIPTELDFSGLTADPTDDHCLRLLFGEADTSTQEAAKSCFLVRSLRIQYEGYPGFSAVNDVSGEVGTTKNVTISITTPDNSLSTAIGNDMTFGTSDSSIATFTQSSESVTNDDGSVTITGTVTFTGEGNVSLYANNNGGGGGVSFGASGQAGTGDKDTGGNGTGNGNGNGSGDGSGTGSGNGSDTGTGTPSASTSTIIEGGSSDEADIYLSADEGTENGGGGSSLGDTSTESTVQDGNDKNWTMMEVKDPAITEGLSQTVNNPLKRYMALSAIILFASGIIERIFRYKKQRQ